MKKLIITLAIIMLAATVNAQTCNVGVAWTPDPVGAPSVVEQRVYHNTDGVAGGDNLVGTVGPTVNVHQWTLARACYTVDKVYVTTIYTGGLTVKSLEAPVLDVVGAILTNSVKHQD